MKGAVKLPALIFDFLEAVKLEKVMFFGIKNQNFQISTKLEYKWKSTWRWIYLQNFKPVSWKIIEFCCFEFKETISMLFQWISASCRLSSLLLFKKFSRAIFRVINKADPSVTERLSITNIFVCNLEAFERVDRCDASWIWLLELNMWISCMKGLWCYLARE